MESPLVYWQSHYQQKCPIYQNSKAVRDMVLLLMAPSAPLRPRRSCRCLRRRWWWRLWQPQHEVARQGGDNRNQRDEGRDEEGGAVCGIVFVQLWLQSPESGEEKFVPGARQGAFCLSWWSTFSTGGAKSALEQFFLFYNRAPHVAMAMKCSWERLTP